MKILCLDVSSHTGFAVFCDGKLTEHGLVELPHAQPPKKKSDRPRIAAYGTYPFGFLAAALTMAQTVFDVIARVQPTTVLIEETNPGGRAARYDQKFLEFLHALVLLKLDRIRAECPGIVDVVYISSSEWRRVLGLKLDKSQRKNNRLVKVANNSGAKGAKAKLGVKGRITVKHLAVELVNKTYGLDLLIKDNDVADAVALGMAYLRGVNICTGK